MTLALTADESEPDNNGLYIVQCTSNHETDVPVSRPVPHQVLHKLIQVSPGEPCNHRLSVWLHLSLGRTGLGSGGPGAPRPPPPAHVIYTHCLCDLARGVPAWHLEYLLLARALVAQAWVAVTASRTYIFQIPGSHHHGGGGTSAHRSWSRP